MKCRECDEFRVDYVAGELPSDVLATSSAPSRCRNCVAYLEQYRATIQAGKTACRGREGRHADAGGADQSDSGGAAE